MLLIITRSTPFKIVNIIIGFIVPPINQAITNRMKAKEAEAKLPDYKLFLDNALNCK